MRSTKPALKSGNLVSAVSMAVLAGSLLIALTPHSAALSPYAVEVISAQGPFGPTVYGDTNSVLGAPATRYYDPSGGSRRVKLVEPAFNVASDTNGLITPNLVLTFNAGSQLIVRFDHPVSNNPANPYGIDLLVFGNTLYGAGFVNDATDMNTRSLGGSSSGSADDAVAISVSPGYTSLPGEDANDPSTWPWYRYAFGPYGDTGFPTQAFKWNRTAASWTDEVMDFTKPVNPAMEGVIEAAIGNGLTAADAIDLYAGSGGGTGIDLQASGFAWIQYVRFEGIDPDAYGGEIDAVAAVRPMNLGDALSIAPSNLTNGTATLFFQSPDDQNRTALSVKFNSLSDMALVTTASSDNLTAFAPLPGVALNAALLELSPILGSDPVTFNVDLALSAGQNYSGNGSDLLLCQASGTNWILQPFTFIAENHGLVTQGVTNFSGFAVVQMAAPLIQAQMNTNGFNVTFSSIAGLAYTLECSTNLVSWTPLARFTATNSEPICLRDNSAPADKAFYRLVVARP